MEQPKFDERNYSKTSTNKQVTNIGKRKGGKGGMGGEGVAPARPSLAAICYHGWQLK